MAKKKTAKRKAPTRTCEKCGKGYHPRKVTCPNCGAKNPTYKKTGRKAKKKANRKSQGGGGDLTTALDFVTEMGGIENAQTALDTLKEIRERL